MNVRVALAGLALLSAPTLVGDAAGQVVLEPGVWAAGVLEPSDSIDQAGRVHDFYILPAGFEGLVQVTVASQTFDPTVRIEAPVGEVFRILGESDDSPGLASDTDARAFAEVRPGEKPVIQVQSWTGQAAGSYRIRVDPLPLVEPQAEHIAYGADVRATLKETDSWVNGVFEDRFRFHGDVGDRVRVLLESEEFDAFLEVWDPTGVLLAQDDDGFEVDDAWVEVALPASGTYEIRIRPSPALPLSRRVMLGEYRLRLGPELAVEPDPTLGGLAFTDEERMGLRSDERDIRHETLGFHFPAPAGQFTLLNAYVEAPEVVDPLTQLWRVMHDPSGEELVVMVTRLPEPMTETQLHRIGKRWFQLVGGTLLEEQLDLEGTRSLLLRIAHPPALGQETEIRCRTSSSERIPGLLVCLLDGTSFRQSIAGLEVR